MNQKRLAFITGMQDAYAYFGAALRKSELRLEILHNKEWFWAGMFFGWATQGLIIAFLVLALTSYEPTWGRFLFMVGFDLGFIFLHIVLRQTMKINNSHAVAYLKRFDTYKTKWQVFMHAFASTFGQTSLDYVTEEDQKVMYTLRGFYQWGALCGWILQGALVAFPVYFLLIDIIHESGFIDAEPIAWLCGVAAFFILPAYFERLQKRVPPALLTEKV